MKKILLSMLVILTAAGCSFNLNGKTEEKKDEKNNTIENESYEALNVDDTLVTDLYHKINYGSYGFFGYFYKNDSISVNEIDNKVKIYLALENAEKTPDDDGNLLVADSLVEQAMDDLFGDIDYKNESLAASKCGVSGAKYDENKKQYFIFTGCGGTGYPYYITNLVQARKYSDKIEIYERHIAARTIWNDDSNEYSYSFYRNFDLNSGAESFDLSGIDPIIENASSDNFDFLLNTGEIEKNYIEKTDVYKYTFKLENGKYHFYSAEKVK